MIRIRGGIKADYNEAPRHFPSLKPQTQRVMGMNKQAKGLGPGRRICKSPLQPPRGVSVWIRASAAAAAAAMPLPPPRSLGNYFFPPLRARIKRQSESECVAAAKKTMANIDLAHERSHKFRLQGAHLRYIYI